MVPSKARRKAVRLFVAAASIAAALGAPSPVLSQTTSGPTISGFSGAITHGGLMTLTGAGFGAHGDFHAAGDKLIKMWDDFDDGELRCNDYQCWSLATPEALAIAAEHPRSARLGDRQYRRKSTSLGSLEFYGIGNERRYYASFYIRLSDSFDITTATSGTHQFKVIRWWSREDGDDDPAENVYPAIGHNDGWHLAAEHFDPEVRRSCSQLSAIPNPPGPTAPSTGWHKMAIYIEKAGAVGANDGKLRIWWDNRQVFDWKSHFSSPSLPSYCPVISGDFDADGADLAWHLAFGHYFSSASSSTYAEFDDLYLGHSQARVELANASTIEQATVVEPQPPTSWSSGRIDVKVNLGGLRADQPLWAYVTDDAGRRNVNGFPVSPSSGRISFPAEADTHIAATAPTSNYASATSVEVGGPPTERVSYLRFNVDGLPAGARVTGARLDLVARNGSVTTGGTIRGFTPATQAWAESQPTWNQPLAGSDSTGDLSTVGPVSIGSTYSFGGLQSAVTGNGPVTFVIRSSAEDGAAYYSREYTTAAQRPILRVDYQT